MTSYTLETANNTNKVTATAADDAAVLLTLNGETVENGTSLTWASGDNTLTVVVTENGKTSTTYTVIVTKA